MNKFEKINENIRSAAIKFLKDILEKRQIELSMKDVDNNKGGGGFSIKIPGFKANPACPDDGQVFIEFYDGKLRVHVWNGDQDPTSIIIDKEEE